MVSLKNVNDVQQEGFETLNGNSFPTREALNRMLIFLLDIEKKLLK